MDQAGLLPDGASPAWFARLCRTICQDAREADILDGLKAQNEGGPLMSTMVATEPEATPKAEVTPEELLAMPDGGHYELIDGELRERNVSVLSNLIAAEITRHPAKPLSRAQLGMDSRMRNSVTAASPGNPAEFDEPMSRSSGRIA